MAYIVLFVRKLIYIILFRNNLSQGGERVSENHHTISGNLIAASVLVTSGLYLTNGMEHLEKLVGLKEETVSTVYYETRAYLHMCAKGSGNRKVLAAILKGK